MCTASSHPVPQELTVFWKGTFDSTVDPAHQQRTHWGRVIEQEVWGLYRTGEEAGMTVYREGQDWQKCKGEAAYNEPMIVVGTLTGSTRTLKVYRDSDMSVISTVANSEGPDLRAGIERKICLGYSEWYYNSLASNALWDHTHWRGEFEQVVVYDKVLGEQDITQVVNSLHNPPASAPGPPAPAPGPPGQPVTATIASCTASSHRGHYVCDKVFDGVLAERGRGKDNNEWATEREGVGSWIELNFDHATKINAMKYANRDAWTTDGEANRRVKLEFSAGSPAFVELVQPSTVDDDWDQQYFFPDVETTFVKITVETVWGTFNNGAEEIEFSYVPQGTQASNQASQHYVGCFSGGTAGNRRPDVPITAAGVQSCHDACKNAGFNFFGFECPHDNGNEVHCDCTNTEPQANTALADQKCKEFNTASGGHCSGPFIVSSSSGDYFMGAGSINSIYRVQ